MALRDELQLLSRDELIERARSAGIDEPQRLGKAELVETLAKRAASERRIETMKTWFGVARDLVARVVDRGLHLPEAAQVFTGAPSRPRREPPPPLPTVTLAEIYAAQGYYDKAVATLDDVLARDADHADAKRLRQSYLKELDPDTVAELEERASQRGEVVEAADLVEQADDVETEGDVAEMDSVVEVARAAPPKASAAVDSLDELVALATDPRTAYVYWELRPVRFARARKADEGGRLVLRVLSVTPHEEGSESTSRDLPIDELIGDRFVRGLLPGSEVRLCLGWAGEAGFVPLVVAPEMSMPRDYRADAPTTVWRDPRSGEVVWVPDDPAAETRAERRAAASASAGAKMRRYVAQVAEQQGKPTVDYAELTPLVRGGASDLNAEQFAKRGGASELYGGASELSRSR